MTEETQYSKMAEARRLELIAREGGKPGLRGKINAMCISCTFDSLTPGNWRQQVGNCTVTVCPLHSVRPKSRVEIVE